MRVLSALLAALGAATAEECPQHSAVADVFLGSAASPAAPFRAVDGAAWSGISQDGGSLNPFADALTCANYYAFPSRNNTQLTVACHSWVCDVYAVLYHEPLQLSQTNGQPLSLSAAWWETGSCAAEFCLAVSTDAPTRMTLPPQPTCTSSLPGRPDAELPDARKGQMECSRMTAFRRQVGGGSEVHLTVGEVFGTMDAYYLVLAVAPGVDSGSNSGQSQTEAADIARRGNHTVSPLPHETIADAEFPGSFAWCNKHFGTCHQSRDLHIPLSDGETNYSILTPCGTGCTGAFDPDRVRPKTDAVEALTECLYVYLCFGMWALVVVAIPRAAFEGRRVKNRILLWLQPPPPVHNDHWQLPLPLGFIDTRSPRRRARPATPPTPRTPQQGCSPAPSTYSSSSSSTCSPRSPQAVRLLRREVAALRRAVQRKNTLLSDMDRRLSSANSDNLVTSTRLFINTRFLGTINASYQQERQQHRATEASLDAANGYIQLLSQELEAKQRELAQMRAGQSGAAPAAAPPSGGNW